jgi:hypothetical protein
MDTRPNKMAAIPIHAHVTCHWESFLAATIWYVRGSKTMYSPGVSETNRAKRRCAAL